MDQTNPVSLCPYHSLLTVSGAAAERGAAYEWPGIEPAPPAAAAHTRDGDQRGHPDRAAAAVRLRLQVTRG